MRGMVADVGESAASGFAAFGSRGWSRGLARGALGTFGSQTRPGAAPGGPAGGRQRAGASSHTRYLTSR